MRGLEQRRSLELLSRFARRYGRQSGGRLEGRRMAGSDGEGTFKRDAHAAYRAFVEETAYQCDAMRNPARGRKFGQRMLRVGGPIGARLADFHKTGAQRERRVAGIVADGEHFVPQRRDEEQIHVRKNARHLLADFATEAISLNKIHSRKKTGLAKEIGPGIVRLHFELINGVIQGDLLEGGGAFGKKVEIEAAVGPVGEKNLDGAHAELGDSFESGAVDVGGKRLFHPFREITD